MRLIPPAMHRGNLARDISMTLIGQSIRAVVNTNQDARSMREICINQQGPIFLALGVFSELVIGDLYLIRYLVSHG